jgi:hypothetical protein
MLAQVSILRHPAYGHALWVRLSMSQNLGELEDCGVSSIPHMQSDVWVPLWAGKRNAGQCRGQHQQWIHKASSGAAHSIGKTEVASLRGVLY